MSRKSILYRDGLGRFNGQLYLDNHQEDEYWEDRKVKEVVFPIHNQYKSGDVHIWNLNDIKEM